MMSVCVKSLCKDQTWQHLSACVLERETWKLAAFVDTLKCGKIGLQFVHSAKRLYGLSPAVVACSSIGRYALEKFFGTLDMPRSQHFSTMTVTCNG